MDNVRVKIEERLRAAFSEVMQKAGVLIDEALDEHFADMKAIFLRDRNLAVSLALAVDMNEAGQIEVAITCGYVKEKVKQKTTARVTPGQTEIPPEAYRTVDPGRPEPSPTARPVVLIGAPPKLLGNGEATEDAARSCMTCRHSDADGCNHPDNDAPCGPSRLLWESLAESANPFVLDAAGTQVVDAPSRTERVKEFNVEQLRAVIALPGCQKSVVKAAERRLKKMEKEEARKNQHVERTCDNCLHGFDVEICKRDDQGDLCVSLSGWQPVASAPEPMTCGNCGSREGDTGCGLEVGENDEPCNSWSLKVPAA